MNEHELGVAIRDVFDRRHEASPGLEQRVVDAIPWERPAARPSLRPRLAGAFAVALALVLVAALAAPSILNRLGLAIPGSTNGSSVAYSLAAVDGGSVFVIQRGESQGTFDEANVLIESSDGGRTWTRRLAFHGIYDGMKMFGKAGALWALEMSFPTSPCTGTAGSCPQPTSVLAVYRTTDAGATWTAMPKPALYADTAYFLDGALGWTVASPPQIGLGQQNLYSTSDGGVTWTSVGPLPNSRPTGQIYGVGAYQVTFSDPGTGWYVGNGALFQTLDGGQTWHTVGFQAPAAVAGWTLSPSQPLFRGRDGIVGIGFRNPQGADNATATRVYFYVSADGGRTWGDPRPAPAATAPVGDDWVPAYLDLDHIWLTSLSLSGGDNVQAGPAVARSSDGGRTWSVATSTPRILSLAFTDAHHGFGLDVSGIYNDNGIVATNDGGATWYRVTLPVFS